MKTVIFDLGGVVLEDGSKTVLGKIKQRTGESVEELDEVFHSVTRPNGLADWETGRISTREFLTHLYRAVDIGVPTSDFEKWLIDGFIPIQETWDLIKSLEGKVKLVLFTNHNKKWLKKWQRQYSIFKEFDYIFNSAEIKLRKPMPEAYQYVLEHSNSRGHECLMIDDNPENLYMARKFGMETFLFHGHQSIDRLKKEIESFMSS